MTEECYAADRCILSFSGSDSRYFKAIHDAWIPSFSVGNPADFILYSFRRIMNDV